MKTKNLLLLLLLITFSSFGQGVITPFDQIKLKQNQKKNDATRVLVQDSIKGNVGWVLKSSLSSPTPSLDAVAAVDNHLTDRDILMRNSSDSEFKADISSYYVKYFNTSTSEYVSIKSDKIFVTSDEDELAGATLSSEALRITQGIGTNGTNYFCNYIQRFTPDGTLNIYWHSMSGNSIIYFPTPPNGTTQTLPLKINGLYAADNGDLTIPVGTGTVTSITASSPLTGGTITASGSIGIQNAAADSTTKGAASFFPADFDSSSGNISLDYTNGQKATTSLPGYLSATDWNTFNGKQASLVSGTNIKTVNSNSLLGSGNILVEPVVTATTSSDYYRGDKTFATLNKTAVGLSNVDNTSDASKPVSTAQQTALDLKVNKSRYIYQSKTSITGVTGQNVIFSMKIPAGVYASTDGFALNYSINKLTTATTVNYTVYVGTTLNALTTQIANVIVNGSTRGIDVSRNYYITSGNLNCSTAYNGNNFSGTSAQNSSVNSDIAVTMSNDLYLTFTADPTVITEVVGIGFASITPLK